MSFFKACHERRWRLAEVLLSDFVQLADRLVAAAHTGDGIDYAAKAVKDVWPPSADDVDYRRAISAIRQIARMLDASPDKAASGIRFADDLASEVKKLKSAPSTAANDHTIILDLGNRLYRIGQIEKQVTRAEDNVLQTFLDAPAQDTADLIAATKSDRAPRVLRELRSKYDGIFAPAITLPRSKGAGGYVVRVKAPE